MLTENSSLSGSIYEVVKTVEFDMELDEERFPMRVELLQCLSNPHQFRTRTWAMNFRDHTWKAKFYSERSIFPHDEMVDQGEGIFVDYSYGLSEDCSKFEADTQEAAIQVIVDNLKDFVNCFTNDSH